ncbi:MAG: DUF1353 domain-containing protein [Hyphomicrobium sp.]
MDIDSRDKALKMNSARATTRVVEIWDRRKSDACSVPSLMRLVVSQETAAQCQVCERHDEAYYYGGSRAQRRDADERLRSGLIEVGMSKPRAWGYWLAVRLGGAPWLRIKGVSWAFAGAYFKYSPDPAAPADGA